MVPGGQAVGDEGVQGAVRRYLATRGTDFAPPSLGECCAVLGPRQPGTAGKGRQEGEAGSQAAAEVTPGLASAHAATQGLTNLVDNMLGSSAPVPTALSRW